MLSDNLYISVSCRVPSIISSFYDRQKSQLANQDIYSVVQPDVCVVCNPNFLDKQGCNGVHECWIVYPNDFAIHQFILDENKKYQLKAMFTDDDVATPALFPDLKLDLTQIFESFD